MKIGILTYHRSHNYGALLQGIALREVLTRMGHQVTFVDYWPAYHRHMYALFSFQWMMTHNGFRGKLGYLKECIKNYHNRRARKQNFDNFINEHIEPYTSSMDESYDVVVHGSDQIWRKQPEINRYNAVYFGQNEIRTALKISYAASMGILPQNDTDKKIMKALLSHLDAISVRESSLKDLVEELGYRNVKHNIDPTLLLPQDFWVKKFDLNRSGERYALYYKIQDSFDITEIERYIHGLGLKLKVVHHKAQGRNTGNNIIVANPLLFLQLIYGAEVVFTSSFHGLAFSLLFHKPFFASFTQNSGRAISLLKETDLKERLLQPKSSIPLNIKEIEFSRISIILDTMAAQSKQDLKILLCKNHSI